MIVYWDTSALLKLYVVEAGSAEIRELVQEASANATSVISYAEARAALAALARSRRISKAELETARLSFDLDWRSLTRMEVGEDRCRAAGRLAEEFGLRGCDSLHLACYVDLTREAAPEEVRFCCFDRGLAAAAAAWQRRYKN